MPVIIRRKGVPPASTVGADALSFIGLGVDVLPLGSRVVVVSPLASRFVCRDGDLGEVIKHCRAGGNRDVRPRDDLYFVRLDSPGQGKEVVYLTYSELRRE